MTLVIAVDGPAASGKGTIAARLAAHYGLPYLDTGLLYRAVGLAVLDAGGDLGDAEAAAQAARALDLASLNDNPRLTERDAGEAASRVASCSTIATERCFPPVHPTAIIAKRLPSPRYPSVTRVTSLLNVSRNSPAPRCAST